MCLEKHLVLLLGKPMVVPKNLGASLSVRLVARK